MRLGMRTAAAWCALPAAAAAALVVMGGGASGVRAAGDPITPVVRYVQLLQAARAALPGDVRTAEADLDEAAAAVRNASGLLPVREALAGRDVGRAEHLLDNTIAALALPVGAEPGDPADALQRLQGVYARPPLDRLDQPRSESALGRLAGWVASLLGRLGGGNRPLALLIAGAVLGLLVALAVRRFHGIGAGPGARVGDDPGDAGVDPGTEWAQAFEAAARGDHREAVRRAFRGALLAVAVRGRLPVDPAWTTRELLAHTRGDADLLAALAPAAAAFDVAWYSGRPVTQEDWDRQRDRCAAIRALAGRSPARTRGTRW